MNTKQLLLITSILLILPSDHVLSRHSNTIGQRNLNINLERSCEADSDCPPWTECNNTECVCRENLENLTTVNCDKSTLQLSVLRCHCVTYDNETQELTEGKCFENCANGYDKSEYLPLPLELTKLNQFMCEERWNRTGRLCGSCLPGHSPLAYSYDITCVKCPEGNKNFWKYILVAFGPLTIFYFIVLIFKIKATSLYLHGYIIFCQVIGSTPLAYAAYELIQNDKSMQVPIKSLGAMYTLWNLDFFRGLYPDICLDVSPLTVFALDYAVAIYPLLLTVVSYILIELHARNVRIVVVLWKPFRYLLISIRRNWNGRTTVIDAFATFFLLSFGKMAITSYDLLTPAKTQFESLNTQTGKWVLYYDANMDYFGSGHLPFAILACVCLTLFTAFPMLFMLVFQFRWFQRMLSCLKLRHQLLQAVMESFQSCYKNGTEPGTKDYRWFAAVHLIGCFGLFTLYTVILDSGFYPYGLAFLVCVMMFTALVQPYKNSSHTKIDILFWGVITAILCFSEGSNFNSLRPTSQLKTAIILRAIVLVFPLLYMICISVYWILSRMKKVKTIISRIKAWRRGYESILDNFHDDVLPDRLIRPQDTKTCIIRLHVSKQLV